MPGFDMGLLYIFDEIYKTRNVTRAAANLDLPQSTVSIGLGKLRTHFNDRLFTRTSNGMEPTPRAQIAIQNVRNCLSSLQDALEHQTEFSPSESQRRFRICMTDISEVVLLPTLLNYLKRVGPGIKVDVSKISQETPRELESGEVDIAVGFMPHLEAGFYQQKLFDQNFICLVAASHPRVRGSLKRSQFESEGHVLVKSSGTGHSIVDKVLAEKGIERNVLLELPSFLGVARIIAQTEYIVTVPARYGMVMADSEKIKMFEPPVTLPSFSVKQHWHERFHDDMPNRWLRSIMASLFSQG